MNRQATKTALTAHIAKNISYDASGHDEEIKCQHCGGVVRPERTYGYWIDHKGVLVDVIMTYLGLASGDISNAIHRILEDVLVEGKPKQDAKVLSDEIWKELFTD